MTGKLAADAIIEYVNSYSTNHEEFTDTILRSHPTLQQSTIRLFMKVIKNMSEQTYTDGRNEDAVALCKLIIERVGDDIRLPLI